MSRVKITKAFKFAYEGVRVVQIAEDDELNSDDPAAVLALEEKWGKAIPDAKSKKGKGKED